MDPRDPVQAATHRDPYPYYAALRAQEPLAYRPDLKLHIAATARVVREVLHDERLVVRPPAEPVPRAIDGRPAGEVFARLARMNEGAVHAAARKALQHGLATLDTANVFAAARARAAVLAARDGDDDVARLAAWAFEVPVHGVAELIGLPFDPDLGDRVRQFVACLSPLSTSDQLRSADTAALALQQDVQSLVARSTASKGLLRLLQENGLPASPPWPNALTANLVGLFSQTFDATAGLIGNSIVSLIRHPDVRERVRQQPSLVHALVREVSRFDPAVQNTRRFAREPVNVAGIDLQPGDAILVVLAAASRDDAVFDDAERLRLGRPDAEIIGFGAGRHACPGHAIAQAMAAGVIAHLFDSAFAFDDPRIGWDYRPSVNARIPRFVLNAPGPSPQTGGSPGAAPAAGR